jgi:hypothetical protein
MKETSTSADSQPASQSAVPLARLLSSAVPIESHHAVAVVQQLIDQLAPDRVNAPAGSVPPIESIRLEPSGRLRAELGPAGEPFARGLGRVLARLLKSNAAPVGLRLVAMQAASESAPMAFDDLARQIAHWERPGRAAALSALYAQACAVAGSETFPDTAAPPAEEPSARSGGDAAWPKRFVQALRRNRAIVYIAAAVCLATPLAAFGVHALFSPNPKPAVHSSTASDSTPTPSPESPDSHDIELERSAGARRGGRPIAADTVRAAPEPAAPDHTDRPIADEIAAGPVDSKPDVIPSVPLAIWSAGTPAPIASTTREPSVFSSDDAGVSEPILVRPYLPPRARVGTPSELLGVLEVLIDADGTVETVHLRSPDNRYRERWWVFAAKQWQFEPALRNGKPVRFLKRIPLTDLNVLEPQ